MDYLHLAIIGSIIVVGLDMLFIGSHIDSAIKEENKNLEKLIEAEGKRLESIIKKETKRIESEIRLSCS
jgi:hypothetical protein